LKPRPVLFVLAGVNGAGKSSVGGHLLQRAGLAWFNPDAFARELRAATGCDQVQANAAAWHEGMRRLDEAIANGANFAFETTLGGRTVPAKIRAASATHDVLMWFCGLSSPELHIARVRARVAAGGHDIPEAKIRERYPAALQNLIALMPCLAHLQVYDNSAEAAPGEPIPDPVLVAELKSGRLVRPTDVESLAKTPDWAKPLVEAALSMGG
jgi:predicted ABC-type ATPase